MNRGLGFVALLLLPVFFWKFFEAYDLDSNYPRLAKANPVQCEIVRAALATEIDIRSGASHILVHTATIQGPPQTDRIWVASGDWALDSGGHAVWRYLHDIESCIPTQSAASPIVATYAVYGPQQIGWMLEMTRGAQRPARIACLFLAEPEVQPSAGLASIRFTNMCTDQSYREEIDLFLERDVSGWAVTGRMHAPGNLPDPSLSLRRAPE